MATTLPAPQSYIVDTTVNGTGVNYSRNLQEVPIIADHANIYVTENVNQTIYNSTVKVVSPDFVTATAIATEPPVGRKIGAVYFDAQNNILYAWNGTLWYKIGEALNNVVTGDVVINGNLTTLNTTTGNIISSNIVNGGTLNSSGTITGGNIISLGTLQSVGDISGPNISASGNISGGNISATGNISGVNVSVTGNISGSNVTSTGNMTVGIGLTSVNITSTGNTVSNNLTSSNLTVTGNSIFQGTSTFNVFPSFPIGTPNTVLYLDAVGNMTSGASLNFNGSNLGIGILPTTAMLDVNGNGRVRSDFSVLGMGDGITVTPGAAGLGSTVKSRNQSDSGIVPLTIDASPLLVRPNGATANGLYVSTLGIGANTVVPVSEMDVNGVLSVTRSVLSPLDLRPTDDATVNWRIGGHTTASKQGVLQIQNNGTGTGGSGTEVLTIDQQNNYGIGTVGPLVQYNTANPNARVNINGSITGGTDNSTSGSVLLQGRNGVNGSLTNIGTEFSSGGAVISYGMIPSTGATGAFTSSYTPVLSRSAITVSEDVRIYTGALATVPIGAGVTVTPAFTVTNAGLVGVRKATPLFGVDIDGNSMVNLQVAGDYSGIRGAAGGNASLMLQSNQTAGQQFWVTTKTDNTLHIGGIGAAEPTTGALVVTSTGDIVSGAAIAPYKFSVVGVTNNRTFYAVADSGVTTDVPITAYNAAGSGDNVLIDFLTDPAPASRGSITFNRTTLAVSYNTVSDYRAKTLLGPVNNPGETIDKLTVHQGLMNGAVTPRPMLVAHEAQAVTPWAVTGEVDAVDDKGNPIYQQVDHQILVPLLIAEIQELRKRVSSLESIITK